MMTHNAMIAVIQAHRDGKILECSPRDGGERWYPVHGQPNWNFRDFDYRIKPEPPKPREWWLVNHCEAGAVTACEICGPFVTKERAKIASNDPLSEVIHVREVLPE